MRKPLILITSCIVIFVSCTSNKSITKKEKKSFDLIKLNERLYQNYTKSINLISNADTISHFWDQRFYLGTMQIISLI